MGESVQDTLKCYQITKLYNHTSLVCIPMALFSPYLLWLAAGIHRDEEDLHDPFVTDRQWNTKVAEGIEGHRYIATIRANQC